MKRIILSAMVVAFAVAVQAGDSATCQDKDKAACCPSKVKTSIEVQASQATDKAAPACCASKVKTSLQTQTSQDSKEGSSCCPSKVKTSVEAKGSCPFTAGGCSKQGQAKQNGGKRNVLLSPKANSIASK